MVITYLSSSTIPSRTANSVHVMKMCQAFANLGHQVYLIAPQKPDKESLGDTENVFSFYGVDENFEVIEIPWFDVKGRGHIYGYLAARRAKKYKPDLIYGRNVAGCFFASFRDTPVIFETHTPVKSLGWLTDWQLKKRLNKFKRIVSISSALKQYYVDVYGINETSIFVAHDGADPWNYPKLNDKSKNKGKYELTVGYIGQLYPGKGMEIILPLAERCTWAEFNVIGGTEDDIEYWKNMAIDIPNICFHGFVTQKQLPVYQTIMDVFLAPYQKTVYGAQAGNKNRTKKLNISQWMSPLKIFEYMSCGKPIICSNLPVLREILIDGETAILCEPNHLDDWISALESLRTDHNYRDMLGENAKNTFLEKHTWLSRAEQILLNCFSENILKEKKEH